MTDKIYLNQDEEDSQDGKSGSSGGVAGEVRFRYKDAMSTELSASEIKRLLKVHDEIHLENVKKQKTTRKDRKAVKEGRQTLTASNGLRSGYGAGKSSPYQKHPILNSKAQFNGADRQMTPRPDENMAETNNDKRPENRLENQLKNRLKNENRNELRNRYTPTLRR